MSSRGYSLGAAARGIRGWQSLLLLSLRAKPNHGTEEKFEAHLRDDGLHRFDVLSGDVLGEIVPDEKHQSVLRCRRLGASADVHTRRLETPSGSLDNGRRRLAFRLVSMVELHVESTHICPSDHHSHCCWF